MLCQQGSPLAGFSVFGGCKFLLLLPLTDQGQISCWVNLNIQSIAAGLSQCLIVNILNDVMWSGLECFASKGLHGLDF